MNNHSKIMNNHSKDYAKIYADQGCLGCLAFIGLLVVFWRLIDKMLPGEELENFFCSVFLAWPVLYLLRMLWRYRLGKILKGAQSDAAARKQFIDHTLKTLEVRAVILWNILFLIFMAVIVIIEQTAEATVASIGLVLLSATVSIVYLLLSSVLAVINFFLVIVALTRSGIEYGHLPIFCDMAQFFGVHHLVTEWFCALATTFLGIYSFLKS